MKEEEIIKSMQCLSRKYQNVIIQSQSIKDGRKETQDGCCRSSTEVNETFAYQTGTRLLR